MRFAENSPKDGLIQKGAYNNYCCNVSFTSAIGSAGLSAEVVYSGQAPGIVSGVSQINFRLPSRIAPNIATAYVVVASEGQSSNPVGIYVKN